MALLTDLTLQVLELMLTLNPMELMLTTPGDVMAVLMSMLEGAVEEPMLMLEEVVGERMLMLEGEGVEEKLTLTSMKLGGV